MEFKEGGRWIYAMVGPDGNKQWCWADYQKIESNRRFIMTEGFGDENGKADQQMPSMKWTNIFTESNGVTNVEIEIEFSSEADLQKIIEMGFEEGFTAAHSNLDEMLQKNAVF